MTITTYRVPQLMSKRITVLCVNDRPICTVRGREALARMIARLNGYDVSCGDGRIDKIIDEMKGETK